MQLWSDCYYYWKKVKLKKENLNSLKYCCQKVVSMEPSKLLANDKNPVFSRYNFRKRYQILDLKLQMLKVSGSLPPLKSEKS